MTPVKIPLPNHRLGDRWEGIAAIGPVTVNGSAPADELVRVRMHFVQADGSWAAASGSGIGDFLADGSVPMTGDLNLNGNDITGINTFTTTTLNVTP